jgi:hypothetical protein
MASIFRDSYLSYSSTLKMEAARSLETSGYPRYARRYNPADLFSNIEKNCLYVNPVLREADKKGEPLFNPCMRLRWSEHVQSVRK